MYSYTYTLLRYVHDTTTGEFLNVGVAIFSPEARFIAARCRKTYGRVARVFPDLDSKSFKNSMRFIERRFDALAKKNETELPLNDKADVLAIARSVLPEDDSALQWAPFGSGVSRDLAHTLEGLFDRMIQRYEERNTHERRTDSEIWRDFKKHLDIRDVSHVFEPKTITIKDDEVEFKHAWKNGQWHCMEPLSFDLSTADSIRDKAHRSLGQLTSVQDSLENFKIYLLVGEPQDPNLRPAFENAISILEKAQVDKEIVLEAGFPALSKVIEDEIRDHERRLAQRL